MRANLQRDSEVGQAENPGGEVDPFANRPEARQFVELAAALADCLDTVDAWRDEARDESSVYSFHDDSLTEMQEALVEALLRAFDMARNEFLNRRPDNEDVEEEDGEEDGEDQPEAQAPAPVADEGGAQ